MTIDEAIKAHAWWKARLEAYIDGELSAPLDASVVETDNACALGKWIHRQSATLEQETDFCYLRSEHARFHRQAAAVVRTADEGNRDSARAMILRGSRFAETSANLVLALVRLRAKVER